MTEHSVSYSPNITPCARIEKLQEYFLSLPPKPKEKEVEPSPSLGATQDVRRRTGTKYRRR